MCLTLRGKIVFSMMGALLCLCMIGLLMPQVARSVPDPSAVYSYTVQPGDTLWSYASAITPDGGDVRDTIDDLISLNHLDGVSLQVGQQLKVPIV
ncbi:MAG: LysM peptidoglycan-binding domain-containing protein [Bifidobacterium bifidum]|nr:LysM peptidoglycan-binding domain-containing protein [Bifidobacterium bifidum]